MPVVYCDADGRPLLVVAVKGDPPGVVQPPADEAFSVGIDDDTARKIRENPDEWRFAGEHPSDGKHMRYIGNDTAADTKLRAIARTFAETVATRRKAQRAEQDVMSMFSRP